MSYVDAGYAICLAVLALYAASLVFRRRRLERADALRADPSAAVEAPLTPAGPPGS
ncbi:MAG: hypothetical protein ACRDWN_07455 [Acidimicrobiales bacterium]